MAEAATDAVQDELDQVTAEIRVAERLRTNAQRSLAEAAATIRRLLARQAQLRMAGRTG